MPSSKGSSRPRDQTGSLAISCIGRQVLYHYCLQGSPPRGGIANECWAICHQYSQIRGPHPSIKYENQNLMRKFFYMLFGDCFFLYLLGLNWKIQLLAHNKLPVTYVHRSIRILLLGTFRQEGDDVSLKSSNFAASGWDKVGRKQRSPFQTGWLQGNK